MEDFHFSPQLVVVLPSKRWFVVVRTVRDFEITFFLYGVLSTHKVWPTGSAKKIYTVHIVKAYRYVLGTN